MEPHNPCPKALMEKLPCEEVLKRLWAYIDGELAAPDAAAVREHLDVCGRCFPRYDFHRAYRDYVGRLEEEEVPPGLRRRIFEQLLAADGEAEGP